MKHIVRYETSNSLWVHIYHVNIKTSANWRIYSVRITHHLYVWDVNIKVSFDSLFFSLTAVWVLFTRLDRYPDLSPVVLVCEVSFACRPHTGRKSLQTQTLHGPVRTLTPPPLRSPPPAFYPHRTRGVFIERDSLSHTLNKPLIHGHRLYGTP